MFLTTFLVTDKKNALQPNEPLPPKESDHIQQTHR